MNKDDYLSTAAWKELEPQSVLGRPTQVWRERPRHVLDLLDLAAVGAGQDLLVHGDRRISFTGFRRALEAGAAELARLGLKPGDRLLIVLYNSAEFLLAQWSAWRLGLVPVLGNRWWSARELAEVAARVNPALIITDMDAPGAAPEAQRIGPADVAAWWSAPAPAKPAPDPRAQAAEDDVALMLFTAGSTGVPKGVQLSHRNLVWTLQTVHILRGGRPSAPASAAEQKVALMTTPMFHNGAVVAGLSALIDGNRMVMLRGRFDAEEVMQLVQKERVSSWSAVPTMISRVLRHPKLKDYDLSSLVAPATGGTMVLPQLVALVQERLPTAAKGLSVGYGMTEASFLTMTMAAQIPAKPGLVGKAVPGVELRVDKPGADGEGELMARSGAVMIGYFGSEEQPIDAQGWYHTGDLGRIDADGLVYVTGRVKDMVIRGGENIACPHVESALLLHPDVLEAAVLGCPDDEFGEAVAAVLHLRAGARLSAEELSAHARQHLAYFEVPTRWVLRGEPLPVLPTGKIDKRSLSAELAGAPGRQDA